MNIIVCIQGNVQPLFLVTLNYQGNTIWTDSDSSGAAAAAPACTSKGAARARPGAYKARAAGEEACRGHQA